MKLNRRNIGGGILIATGIIAFIIPFLFIHSTQHGTPTPPPPTGGNNHGNNGGTTPPCRTNCPGTGAKDNQAPITNIQITGMIHWLRGNITYYYPNFTITLRATDDGYLTSIHIDFPCFEACPVFTFPVSGKTANVSLTVTFPGLHSFYYYSIDQAGNLETPHLAVAGLAKPDVSDLQNIINNSGIDNAGIKNSMDAKVQAAQDRLSRGQPPNSLNALSNQLNALAGKHGLDQATVDLLQSMIAVIIGAQSSPVPQLPAQRSQVANWTIATSLATVLAWQLGQSEPSRTFSEQRWLRS
jgi:hypothetical protein